MTGRGQLCEAGVHIRADRRIRPGRTGQRDSDEDAVVAIRCHGGERLTVDGHDADAVLARAFGDQLLDPRPEGRELSVDDKGQLVAPVLREGAHGQAQGQAGVPRRVGLAAGDDHRPGAQEQLVEVDAEQRARHQAHVRQGGVAATDIGWVEEDFVQVVVMGDRPQAPVRVRDRDHEVARLRRPAHVHCLERLRGSLPLVGLERERLGRSAGLGGDDEEGADRVQIVERRGNGRRVGRVQDADRGRAGGGPEDVRQKRRRQAAAAHPAEHSRSEALLVQGLGECLELARLVGKVERRLEPAQAGGDRALDDLLARPDGGIAPADGPVGPVLAHGQCSSLREGGFELRVAKGQVECERTRGVGVGHSGSLVTVWWVGRTIVRKAGSITGAPWGIARRSRSGPPTLRWRGPCRRGGRGEGRR